MAAHVAAVTHPNNLERRLFRQVRDTCSTYGLLNAGDRVLVAVSGGKDSYTMLHLLSKLVRSLEYRVELVAVHLDQRQPGYDGRPLIEWLEKSGVSFEILSEDTYSVVVDKLEPGATYCSLCSRLRRGILYSAAERLGCNKIALGHHRDDGLETFLLNLFYSGKLQAMPASFRDDADRFDVIRPLIECAENDIAEYAMQLAFPILPCNLCGSQEGLKREKISELLSSLERENPRLRAVMASALANVRPTHLLDRSVRDAWLARPTQSEKESNDSERAPAHFQAEPVVSRVRLPLVRNDS
ncbi:MAG: tRNA 2-thiocytidine(32) synthetase TtcA [Polyangiaceae bacterium]